LGNRGQDHRFNPRPVLFTSPLFTNAQTGEQQNYHRVAFEADLPRIEGNTNPICQRFVSNPASPNPGQGCVNPPTGANFYPFFTTRGGKGSADTSMSSSKSMKDDDGGEEDEDANSCTWQLGGANLPGVKETFGGSSTTEFGPLLQLAYPAANGQVSVRFNNFRQVLSDNPCRRKGNIAALD
jgi:hypothetical protein